MRLVLFLKAIGNRKMHTYVFQRLKVKPTASVNSCSFQFSFRFRLNYQSNKVIIYCVLFSMELY